MRWRRNYGPADFTLTDTGPTTVSGPGNSPEVTNQPIQVGTYTLSESGPAGYQASWQCTGAILSGTTLTVEPGQSVYCVVTNTAPPSYLTLLKLVDNGTTGATAVPADFVLSAAGPVTVTGDGNSPEVTLQEVPAGTYALGETGPDGYQASAWQCVGAASSTADSVTIIPGNSAYCEVTNTAKPSTLTLVKTVTNDNGGTASPLDWILTATGPTSISGRSLDPSVSDAPVQIGDYTLGESGGPTGYLAGAWNCPGAVLNGDTVTVELGQDVVCAINNDDQPSTLSLIKYADNGTTGATHTEDEWTLTATGPTTISGPGNSAAVTDQTVDAGTYTLSESGGPAGYTPGAWTCVGEGAVGDTVVVPNGETVSCYLTNTAQQPYLTLVKDVTNDNGGTAQATDWFLLADGPTPIFGLTGDAEISRAPVAVGSYLLAEFGPDGYTASDWDCGPTPVTGGAVTVGLGADITCTVTNDDQPATLTLVKDVDPNGTGSGLVPDGR